MQKLIIFDFEDQIGQFHLKYFSPFPGWCKRETRRHLDYSSTSKYVGCRHNAEIIRNTGCVAKVWGNVVPVKYLNFKHSPK
jgi:hypothetical protein